MNQLLPTGTSTDSTINSDAVKGGNIIIGQPNTDSIDINPNQDNTLNQNTVNTPMENPITLKECCCQALIKSCIQTKPATLFSICVDYMSWDPSAKYNCSMMLPRHMNTASFMMELLDYQPEKTTPHVMIKQVLLYDDLLVDQRVKDYLLKQSKTRTYKVVLNKLMAQTMSDWSEKWKPSWQDLDPYSSLEDVGDTNSDTAPNNHDTQTSQTRYGLRVWQPLMRQSNRPVRSATKSISYTAMFQDTDDQPTLKKPKKHVPPILSGPSKAMMLARNKPTVHPKITHPVVKPA